jgi:NAD(P)-dependent dehydrogenase (short-subunit alcohol dehydrogenase family)
MRGFTEHDVKNQAGKCFVVTGANTGLGFETARVLASKGARVLLACRNTGKGQDAKRRIGAQVAGADLDIIPLDQADLASVRAAADLIAREPKVDVLVNNAGVMMPPLGFTKDGFEQQFGVNHLGTFALTALLLPKLAETPNARVVITSSLAHKSGRIDFDNLDASKGYKAGLAYSQSKLANLLFLFELDRRLCASGSSTIAVACHPGFADTDLSRHMPGVFGLFSGIAKPFINSAAMGAWPTLYAATSPNAEPGGFYGPQGIGELRGGAGPAKRSDQSRDADLASRLWSTSIAMTGIDPGLN